MIKNNHSIGILLTNIGTPEHCDRFSVRNYLRQFLNDPRVIKLPKLIRFALLEGFILRTRPKKSLEAYQKIWQPTGSPLKILTESLAQKLEQKIVNFFDSPFPIHVTYGMSYSQPSIKQALSLLIDKHQCEKLIVIPLYPQASATTTCSTFDFIAQDFLKREFIPSLTFINQYADYPPYIEAICQKILVSKQDKKDWHLLLSFHGIPQDYVKAGDRYEEFCRLTTSKIKETLNLKESDYTLSFQSRLGPRAWLKPYTSEILKELPKRGIKKILAICPGFSIDCLETLEEISMQNKEIFFESGGEQFEYIPALNDDKEQINLLFQLVKPYLSQLDEFEIKMPLISD